MRPEAEIIRRFGVDGPKVGQLIMHFYADNNRTRKKHFLRAPNKMFIINLVCFLMMKNAGYNPVWHNGQEGRW